MVSSSVVRDIHLTIDLGTPTSILRSWPSGSQSDVLGWISVANCQWCLAILCMRQRVWYPLKAFYQSLCPWFTLHPSNRDQPLDSLSCWFSHACPGRDHPYCKSGRCKCVCGFKSSPCNWCFRHERHCGISRLHGLPLWLRWIRVY